MADPKATPDVETSPHFVPGGGDTGRGRCYVHARAMTLASLHVEQTLSKSVGPRADDKLSGVCGMLWSHHGQIKAHKRPAITVNGALGLVHRPREEPRGISL